MLGASLLWWHLTGRHEDGKSGLRDRVYVPESSVVQTDADKQISCFKSLWVAVMQLTKYSNIPCLQNMFVLVQLHWRLAKID